MTFRFLACRFRLLVWGPFQIYCNPIISRRLSGASLTQMSTLIKHASFAHLLCIDFNKTIQKSASTAAQDLFSTLLFSRNWLQWVFLQKEGKIVPITSRCTPREFPAAPSPREQQLRMPSFARPCFRALSWWCKFITSSNQEQTGTITFCKAQLRRTVLWNFEETWEQIQRLLSSNTSLHEHKPLIQSLLVKSGIVWIIINFEKTFLFNIATT